MKRRNAKLIDFQNNPGCKILTAKFGNQSKSIIASGDDKNNICLWKFSNDIPIKKFAGQNQTNHQIETTAVQFNHSDNILYTGTNRGIISVLDLEAQKLSHTLKGHGGGISSLAIFPYEDQKNLLISGSMDTNIKIWDLRTKECVHQFKGHTMLVNCLAGSPDGKMIASGGSDSQVRLWDQTTGKCSNIFTLHDASVTCLQFNPVEMALASASADRTVKYYDLDTYTLISQTKPEATSIQKILFNVDGDVLFSAAHESLKVWNLDKDGLLLDNVESQWRGIMDMQISENEDNIIGVTSYQQNFALWVCPLKLINMDSSEQAINNQLNRVKTGQQNNSNNPPQRNFLPQIDPIKGKSPPTDDNTYAKIHSPENHLPGNQRSYSEMHSNNYQNNQDYQYLNQGYQNTPQILQTKVESYPNLPQINNNSVHHNLPNQYGYAKQQSQEQFGYPNQQQVTNQNMLPPTKSPQIINAVIHNQYSNDDQMLNKKKIVEQEEDEHINEAIINKQFEELNNQSRIYNQILPPKEQIKIESNLSSQSSKEEIEEEIETQENNKKQKPKPQSHDAVDRNFVQPQSSGEQPLDQSSLSIVDSIAQSFHLNAVFDQQQQQLLKQTEFIGDISKEHQKFLILMNNRLNYVKPIQHWWNQGNSKSSLYAISQLYDPCYVMDALQMTLNMNKLQYVNVEGVGTLLQKCKILIESKYQSHIKFGLEFVKKILEQYRDELINVKTFSLMSKVDLAREERIKKYNSLIDELRSIQKISRIKKIVERKAKEDIGQLANLVLTDLNYLFGKLDNAAQQV
ncbi:katanin con80 domain protein (macronuclear) [Tetrahymena thermophila SB210]|uniref:Katanin p80 WD40 repeat-containing subunit B1 homolog n=1 Tax=Tetrahymena thermophila (strain SB210) TaxID=312017 RepID=I7M4N1_TETTS|nr:katanin con80 domain protein [Tetrahymena thermophila SB210]EAS07712.3 katanin con80 domain protein [Tetrahymena thermophila SB210]|eukprot:XP_001027954.3 katanin con80 domain protein [Tetrahymena thermophila SB210]